MLRLWRLLVVVAALLAPVSAWGAPPAASAPAAAPAVDGEDAPDSPRASLRTYLDLCERGRYDEAARYLDLPRGAEKRGEELAQKLFVVLSARLMVNPEQLSPRAEGRTDDGLPPGTDELGKIKDPKGHLLSIRLVRHDTHAPEDEARWVFAQTTVQSIDPLYASLRGKWIRDHLPAIVLEPGPMALYWWQWLAIPALALFALAVGRVLAWITGKLAERLLGRFPWTQRILVRLAHPVTAGFALVVFWMLVGYLALTLRAEDVMARVVRALGYLTFFWALFRTVSVAGEEISGGDFGTLKPSVRSLTSVGVRLGKVVVGAIALMVALSALGYPVTSVVAGLGIGGVALALAAQKTVENLFGSVAILADQPFQVGDTIRVDTVEGTVESIGLRSTRLRTIDRTLIIIPNGKLADMRIESLGPRDRMRFATKLALARDTTPKQMRAIVESIKKAIAAHAKVRATDVAVAVGGFGDQSFDLDISATVETIDATEFAKVREDLLLASVEAVHAAGSRLALPTRHIVQAS